MELTLEKIALRYEKDNHNRSSKAPLSLYLQLFNLLRDMIVKRDLPENYALPPSRQLAIRCIKEHHHKSLRVFAPRGFCRV